MGKATIGGFMPLTHGFYLEFGETVLCSLFRITYYWIRSHDYFLIDNKGICLAGGADFCRPDRPAK